MAISTIDRFRAASLKTSEYGSPPYNWIPPVWDGTTAPKLEDTAGQDPNFPDPKLKCDRQAEDSPGQEHRKQKLLEKWPHPSSDFTHIDPEDFDEDDIKITKSKLGAGSAEFEKLSRFVGPESLGMQRLALVFEWTLCQVTALLANINSTLKGSNPGAYETARKAYIDFLVDLDNREPEILGRPIVPGQSGYGKAVKWAYIDPIIVNGAIVAARVIIRWNPHQSSSGVPIPHSS